MTRQGQPGPCLQRGGSPAPLTKGVEAAGATIPRWPPAVGELLGPAAERRWALAAGNVVVNPAAAAGELEGLTAGAVAGDVAAPVGREAPGWVSRGTVCALAAPVGSAGGGAAVAVEIDPAAAPRELEVLTAGAVAECTAGWR